MKITRLLTGVYKCKLNNGSYLYTNNIKIIKNVQ